MWAEALSEWLGEIFLKALLWVMFAMIAVGVISGSVVYLLMK